NEALLKAGSSAIEMLLAARLPDQSDKLRFSTVTLRPRALVNSDSMRGRKVFTLITNGTAMAMMIRIAMMIAIHFRTAFMAEARPSSCSWMTQAAMQWAGALTSLAKTRGIFIALAMHNGLAIQLQLAQAWTPERRR